jgi:hypothetical protein
MMTDHAARRRSKERVVSEMTGSTADDRSFDATLCIGGSGCDRNRQYQRRSTDCHTK